MEGVQCSQLAPKGSVGLLHAWAALETALHGAQRDNKACLPLGHCRVLSSISGLYPLVAGSTPPVITNGVPRGCQLSCCVGATWSWQPGWGWEDSSSCTAMCVSSACPQESTLARGTRVRVWEAPSARTVAPPVPPQGARAPVAGGGLVAAWPSSAPPDPPLCSGLAACISAKQVLHVRPWAKPLKS